MSLRVRLTWRGGVSGARTALAARARARMPRETHVRHGRGGGGGVWGVLRVARRGKRAGWMGWGVGVGGFVAGCGFWGGMGARMADVVVVVR